MADGTIDIAFDGNNFQFALFDDTELPGMRVAQASLEYSSFGAGYMSGPATKQKRMWAISAIIPATQRASLETLYDAWDTERATGSNDAVVTLVDGLLAADTTVYNTVFTEPPTYSTVGRGRTRYLKVSTVLMEL